jgi:hypothetical protein
MSKQQFEQPSPDHTRTWTCLSCGKKNRSNRRFCWNCETPKDELPETSPTRPSESELAQSQAIKAEHARVHSNLARPSNRASSITGTSESAKFLTILTPLTVFTCLVWCLIGIGQILLGLLFPESPATLAGIFAMPAEWGIAIGSANFFGSIWVAVQLLRVHQGKEESYKKLRNISRSSTFWLAIQTVTIMVAANEMVAGVIPAFLTALEGSAWYLSRRMLSERELELSVRDINTVKDAEEAFLKYISIAGTRHPDKQLLENLSSYRMQAKGHMADFVFDAVTESLLQQLKEQSGRVFSVIIVTEKATEDQFRIARTTFDRVMLYALEQRQKSMDFDDELGFEELMKRCGIEFRVYHHADSS